MPPTCSQSSDLTPKFDQFVDSQPRALPLDRTSLDHLADHSRFDAQPDSANNSQSTRWSDPVDLAEQLLSAQIFLIPNNSFRLFEDPPASCSPQAVAYCSPTILVL
ncbi:hypothetical protein MA16_Dca025174 [Dendrobium catenatum]|uniref:Uncharacterized protein n=1 Tax=Dendrobium catenatum TaxID=906689 RepID=A0A2I0VJP4_9ASPA|nr:hypothetical protein MA16_Dca025174 [Dendrobium catenatum]